jgi:selenocysteine lyase/cysteine desulfurase
MPVTAPRTLTRREWLESTIALAAGTPLRPMSAALGSLNAAQAPGDQSQDEAFWAGVRSQFELAPDYANLVTVVRGVTTKAVRERVSQETERRNVVRPGGTPLAEQRTTSRTKAAGLIGAQPNEIALVRNTTEGVTTVLMNWPLERGDEILTSSAEHGPFYDVLANRAKRDSVVIRRFHYPAPAPSPDAIVEALERAMTPRTRLVMIGHIVLTGQVNPVRAIADRVHARGALLLVDGVLAIGQIPTDVVAMDCDFYAAGFHKLACGPRATAVFYVRPSLVERLPALFAGYRDSQAPMTKFEGAGAHPEPHIIVLADALDFLTGIGLPRIQARMFYLTSRWLNRAQSLPGFRSPVRPEPEHVAGLVSWEVTGKTWEHVIGVLRQHRVLIGGTEHYSGFFGIPESAPRPLLIANAGVFTSVADVDRLADAIEAATA